MKPAGGWTDAFLDNMRMTADPIADGVMDEVFARHGIERVNELLSSLSRSQLVASSDDIADLIGRYITETASLPPWLDPAQIGSAETLFYEHGLTSVVALFYSSLPFCYVMRNEAEVLQLAGQLREHTERRIRETARMIFPVMDAGGMAPGGAGVAAVQRVRLIHAAIRHLVLHRADAHALKPGLGKHLATSTWDVAKQGLPINQEQLAYTLLTFGFTFVTSSRKLGVVLSESDALAYLHIWNVAGYVLGVRSEMMAESWEEAEELFGILQRRGKEATENGRVLAAALIGVQEAHIPPKWLKPAGPIITRYLIGAETADMLGIRPKASAAVQALLRMFLAAARMVDRVLATLGSRLSVVRAISRGMARHIMQPLLADQTRPLVVRGALLDRWKVDAPHPGVR